MNTRTKYHVMVFTLKKAYARRVCDFSQDAEPLTFFNLIGFQFLFSFDFLGRSSRLSSRSPHALECFTPSLVKDQRNLLNNAQDLFCLVFFFLRDLSYVLLTRAFSLQSSGVDLRLPVFFFFFLSCVSASVCVAPSFTLLFRQIYGGKYMFCFLFQVGHCFCLFGGS